MRKKGYLLTIFVLFIFIVGAFALGAFNRKEIRTPDYYEVNTRSMFKNNQWEEGKRMLDEGMQYYSDASGLNELMGRYYYQYKRDYDKARYYLVRAVRENPENVTAKQMLVNVEEESGNYSSAICYVNELLEINPYWQGLWRKKIGLYRKQNNHVEADRLLKRLHQIYPNDSVVTNEYAYNLEESYIKQRKEGKPESAISSLYELVKVMPENETYYMDLVNLLLQQGNVEEALEVSGKGVSRMPYSSNLIMKKAGILAEEGRYQEAIAFVQSRMKYNRSARLASFSNALLAEAANAAKMNDPYLLYGRLYEKTASDEALDYLISASILRGYDEDALSYLAEAKKRRGEQPSLLYKEYVIYKRMGNASKAYSLLSTLVAMNPNDKDLVDELALNRLQQAENLMTDGFYSEALPYVNSAVRNSSDSELKASAMSKAYACNYELKRYDAAMEILDSLRLIYPDDDTYFVKKADIICRKGNTGEALAVLDSAMQDTTKLEMRAMYASAYEEMAVPYIKDMIEEGASGFAFDESVKLLRVNPSSVEGLQYALTTSDMLKRYDAYDYYVAQARSIYPEETVYVVKQAASYLREEEYDRSIDMIRPWLTDYPNNQGLVGAFSENSERKAYQLIKAHRADSALAVVDTALIFDSDNRSLLLAKGKAYEALKQYDSAHYYQSFYIPGVTEAADFERHLNGLRSQSLNNELAAEYLQGRYGEADVITAVGTLSYTHRRKKNAYTGRLNYAGRDGGTGEDLEDQVPGGQGIQLQAEWEHNFSPSWTTTLSAAWASKYFPKLMADLKVSHEFKNDWTLDVHANYRRISTYSKEYRWEEGEVQDWTFNGWKKYDRNLISVGAGLSKTYEQFYMGGKVDGFLLSSNLYFNASAQLKYFMLDDERTSVTITGGLGTAPEANMIDYAMPATFDKLNTMVGLGGTYMFNKNLSLSVMGTWHTFYSQLNQRYGTLDNPYEQIETKYRNLYNVHVQLHIYF